jgi:hypothetical protein
MPESRLKDGREWLIGGDEDVAWITEATVRARTIDAAIPPIFESYCTVLLSRGPDSGLRPYRDAAYDEAVIALLKAHTPLQPWWLGYLETGASDVVFDDAERTDLYANWGYVLMQAGPEQALEWRPPHVPVWNGPLPDLIFPADHSWLLSTLWDDEWSCIGGPESLIAAFAADPLLGPMTRRVALGEDATPPGHTAF